MINTTQQLADLKGYSGCQLKIFRSATGYFVRKIARDQNYNIRLKTQMHKQNHFVSAMRSEEITAPRILNYGIIKKHFYFDMEYIAGTRLVDFIIDADKPELQNISIRLENTIDLFKKTTVNNDSCPLLATSKHKLNNIRAQLHAQNGARKRISTLDCIQLKLDELPELQISCGGFCHGDLTLENIIYERGQGRFFLIDFLDNYIEHYWFDIVKLFQDIEGGWYQFRNPKINNNNILPKMDYLGARLWQQIRQNDPEYETYHAVMLAITFARILPYAQPEAIDYLDNQIFNCLKKI